MFLEFKNKYDIKNSQREKIFTEQDFFRWSSNNFYRTSYNDMGRKVKLSISHLFSHQLKEKTALYQAIRVIFLESRLMDTMGRAIQKQPDRFCKKSFWMINKQDSLQQDLIPNWYQCMMKVYTQWPTCTANLPSWKHHQIWNHNLRSSLPCGLLSKVPRS